MKALLDLAAADHGTATTGGRRYRDLPDPAGTVGVVLESNPFHPGRSGRNHLRIIAKARGEPKARIDETLALAGRSSWVVGHECRGQTARRRPHRGRRARPLLSSIFELGTTNRHSRTTDKRDLIALPGQRRSRRHLFVPKPAVPCSQIIAIGTMLGVGQFGFLFVAIDQGMPPGNAGVVLQSQAAFTIVFAAVALGERPTKPALVGVAIAGAGLVVIATSTASSVPLGAFALTLAGGASWAWATS